MDYHGGTREKKADRLGTLTVWIGKCAYFCFYVFQSFFIYYAALGGEMEIIMKKIGIIMGSDSDLPIVKKAMDMLDSFGIPFEVHVFSAHRTPIEAAQFSKNARQNGFGAIIAAAGMAAHLAGAIAANTTLPVIGIPVISGDLGGMDALLSTVQMPTGIPVATVAINGAANAALLCAQILAVEDAALAKALDDKRARDAKKVLEKNSAVEAEFNK